MFLTNEQIAEQAEERKTEKKRAFACVYQTQIEKVEKLSKAIDLLKERANLTEEEKDILKYYQ